MKLERVKGSEGYVLLEALISMSILVFLLAGTMPYLTDIFEVRQQAKSEVEMTRHLYERSLFWERKETGNTKVSGVSVTSSFSDAYKISIRGEDGNEAKVEIRSVIWSE
ncbi:MAG: hypothetical protein JJU16_04010 [Alkalibacterium sp.]|nr:hypothetical protein [Alkalibacterium sp.]